MVTETEPGETNQVLVCYSKSTSGSWLSPPINFFVQFSLLIDHIMRNQSKVDAFDVHIPGGYLAQMIASPVFSFSQVRRINVYYGSLVDLKQDQIRFQSPHTKVQFCLERDLQKRLANARASAAVDPAQTIDRGATDDILSSMRQRLDDKRSSSCDIRSSTPAQSCPTADLNEVPPRFTCAFCKLILDAPYQLTCGDRYCKSCINDQIRCATCSEMIIKETVWLDRGLQNEMKIMSETCTVCGCSGSLDLYQKHLCPPRQGLRNSSSQNQANPRPALRSRPLSDNDAISPLTDDARVLQANVERLQREHAELQNSAKTAYEQFSAFHRSAQAITNRIMAMNATQVLLDRQVSSVKEDIENRRPCPTDGTLVWSITNVEERRMDARSERHRSIYSPVFFSSQTGYKMRLRLYLNGDETARNTHMSLFVVILRGEYDAILRWPFDFKVTLTLLNQLSPHDGPSKTLLPNTTSSSFQRPTTNMNLAYGFPAFFSLDSFNQNYRQYVLEDTLFIRAVVDFIGAAPSHLGAHEINAVANDEEHVGEINDNLSM